MSKQNQAAGSAAAAQQVFSLIWPGGLAGQAIYCAAKLDIADRLAEGPRSAAQIAASNGAHPVAMLRLLRALCSFGVVVERDDEHFALTDLGATLKTGDAAGVKPWAIMLGAPFIWRPWGELLQTVLTGEPGLPRVLGKSFYEHMAEHPQDAEIYNNAMNAGATIMADSVIRAYDFSGFHTLVDLGGGQGSLLRKILQACPQPRGVLFDLPAVVSTAAELTRSDVADRCQVVGGDFFQAVPAGADGYLLKGIIHGFSDEDASRILSRIRAAMDAAGKVLIIDVVLQPTNEPSPQKAMMDLMMLSLVEGRERTEAEFRQLLDRSGFSVARIIPTDRSNSIVEAIAR